MPEQRPLSAVLQRSPNAPLIRAVRMRHGYFRWSSGQQDRHMPFDRRICQQIAVVFENRRFGTGERIEVCADCRYYL